MFLFEKEENHIYSMKRLCTVTEEYLCTAYTVDGDFVSYKDSFCTEMRNWNTSHFLHYLIFYVS